MSAQLIRDCLQLDAETAARRFFDAQPDDETVKAVFDALLDAEAYEKLADMIYYGSIVRRTEGTTEGTLDETYFAAFRTMARRARVDKDKLNRMLIAAFYGTGHLGRWKHSAENVFLRLAYEDFDAAERLVAEYDRACELYGVLLRADRDKTMARIVERLLYGKSAFKPAMRKFLLENKLDIVPAIVAAYENGDAKTRLAAMRLLLIYKNDMRAARVIEQARATETSASVLRCLDSDRAPAVRERSPSTVKARFQDMMITGRTMSAYDFLGLIRYDRTADTLFFTDDGRVFIVDKGETFDLENRPVEVTGDVGVLHPALLPAKLTYLKQLNIKQCFPQLHRTVYAPGEAEYEYNRSARLAGTVVPAADWKKGLKKQRFRLLNGDNGIYSRAGIVLDGILCEVSFAPTDMATGVVKLGDIAFYRYEDTVKLGGNVYTDGVRPCDIRRLNARLYSECMYAVYAAAGL